MKLEVYNEIISTIHASWSRECFQTIFSKFTGITYDTLVSIYSQEYQKKIKKTYYKHHQSEVMEFYYKCYSEGVGSGETASTLIRIAQENDLSPCHLARIILQECLSHTYCDGGSVPKDVISQMIKDATLVPDEKLSKEVSQCIMSDENTGPLVDTIKHTVGLEYENTLQENLRNKEIPFLGEDDMRSQGYDKTPDFKLQVPIAVDGRVVNWIESKASFGDVTSHRNYLKDQFWSYWNRFGPGMVIYWFGFIDELDCNGEKGIILKDHFPTDVITLTSLVCKD